MTLTIKKLTSKLLFLVERANVCMCVCETTFWLLEFLILFLLKFLEVFIRIGYAHHILKIVGGLAQRTFDRILFEVFGPFLLLGGGTLLAELVNQRKDVFDRLLDV
jgi:hypothetical protein